MTLPTDNRKGPVAGSLTPLPQPTPRRDLATVSLVDLSSELLARLGAGQTYGGNVQLGEQLRQALTTIVDVHENRFSPTRARDQLHPILSRLRPGDLNRRTVVDLGCGSLNPFSFSFLLLALGAGRAYAVDIEPIQDLRLATQAMAAAASWMLLDPTRIVGSASIGPGEVLANLEGFRLPLLAAGNPDGLAAHRLQHRIESIYDLSFADGEVDAVFTVSVLEHLDRLDDAVRSLRRITRPGGVGHHVVDFTDHRRYSDSYGLKNPREFLKTQSFEPSDRMHWSNRVRCDQLCAMFERHDFVVEDAQSAWVEPLIDREQAEFVEPYRSMERRNLEILVSRILVRRV